MKKTTQFPCRQGFTLVELMVVIAIMAILGVAGASGVIHMVPAYQQRACREERVQAARVFVSDWMESRKLPRSDTELKAWLDSYLAKTQVNCSHAADWTITVDPLPGGGGYAAGFTCAAHGGDAVTAQLGQASDGSAGGIGWDGGFIPGTESPAK